MFGSTVLEVAIGLVFIFLLVSLICSQVGDRISEWLGWRANHLEAGIRDLLLNGQPELVQKLYGSPLIQALAPAGQKPIRIPAQTFVLAVFDAFVPGASGQDNIKELYDTIAKLNDSPVRTALLGLVYKAEEHVADVRSNVEKWFNAAEERMTLTYKQTMWMVALVIGLIVSVFLNIDTIAVSSNLWRDSALRETVVTAANKYAGDPDPAKEAKALQVLSKLNLPIGWQFSSSPLSMAPSDWSQAAQPIGFGDVFLKLFGWVLTALAGAQGAPFWFDLLRKLTQRS